MMADFEHNSPSRELTTDAFLGGRLMLLQPKAGYRAGLDAVLLAATVPDGATDIVDLGAGVGTVGLSAVARVAGARVLLAEREPELVGLAAQNIARNDLACRAGVVAVDIEADAAADFAALGLIADRFDHVLANPPFHTEGDGHVPPDRLKARSHVMAAGGVERWTRVMARLAKPGGTAAMIHRADALAEMLAAFSRRFGAITIVPVHPRPGEPAGRVIIAGRKGSRAPSRLLPGLVVHEADGDHFSPTLEAVLRHGAGIDLWAHGAPLLVPVAVRH